MKKRTLPQVNAGSMADIAFLLLIFFLVTTTISQDKGILRNLPQQTDNIKAPVNERNILAVIINADNELLVENQVVLINELTDIAQAFIDNGGASGDSYCDYCQGERDPSSSDHPNEAIIAVTTHREAAYKTFIAVQNELTLAYNNLRNSASQRLYGYDFTTVKNAIKEGTYKGNLEVAKKELKLIQDMYPLFITEIETKTAL